MLDRPSMTLARSLRARSRATTRSRDQETVAIGIPDDRSRSLVACWVARDGLGRAERKEGTEAAPPSRLASLDTGTHLPLLAPSDLPLALGAPSPVSAPARASRHVATRPRRSPPTSQARVGARSGGRAGRLMVEMPHRMEPRVCPRETKSPGRRGGGEEGSRPRRIDAISLGPHRTSSWAAMASHAL